MANLNRVLLMGNLTRDPEVRQTAGGMTVANLGLAVNRNYNTKTGEKKEEVCFVRVVVWGKQAENCGQYLSTGSTVFVEGRLQSRSWETDDGQKRNTLEVVALSVQFMGRSKKTGVSAPKAEGPGGGDETPMEDFEKKESVPPAEPVGAGEDEIPF